MSAESARRFDPVRAFQVAVLVLFETMLIYLVVTLLTASGSASAVRWWLILPVVAASVVANALFEGSDRDATHIDRRTGFVATIAIALSVAFHIRAAGGGFALVGTLLNPDSPLFFGAYTALIAAIVGWWRGGALLDIDHSEMVKRFRRGVIAVMLALAVLTLGGYGQELTPRAGAAGVDVPAAIVAFLLLGLLALSVTRITTVEGDGGRTAQVRWLRESILSSGAILLVGVVVLALVASPAGALLQVVAGAIISAVTVVLTPFIWLAYSILDFLRGMFISDIVEPTIPMMTATPQTDDVAPITPVAPSGLLTATTLLLLLVPVVVLVLLLVFASRRRSRPRATPSEERESIFTWNTLGSDIGSLLKGLRRPRRGQDGLQGALRRLVAQDPATRIRRRYVELLLRGEAADRHRRAEQTPREFAPTLDTVARDPAALDTLTATYEQARYAPHSVAETDAERAERAWHALSDER